MTDTTKPAKPRARTKTPADVAPAPVTAAPAPTDGPTKSAMVIKLLLRAKGATPVELIAATDWQPHSVRAFLSGLRKKGRVLAREPRKNGEAAYRIIVAAADAAADGTTAADDAAATPAAEDRAVTASNVVRIEAAAEGETPDASTAAGGPVPDADPVGNASTDA